MEEQLPVTIYELVILNLYLGSISLLVGVGFVAWVMKRNGKFKWVTFLIIAVLLIALGNALSLVIWANWNGGIYLMIGPFHLPTIISVTLIGGILLKLFGLKAIGNN